MGSSPTASALDDGDRRLRLACSHPEKIWSCGPAAKATVLQAVDRWFESTQDHFRGSSSFRSGMPTAEQLDLNPSDCRFESCPEYSIRLTSRWPPISVLSVAKTSTKTKTTWRVAVPHLRRTPLFNQPVLAEQRSARHPVTVETVGSNPIGDATTQHLETSAAASGVVRKRKSDEAQTFRFCGFDSHPRYFMPGGVPQSCL